MDISGDTAGLPRVTYSNIKADFSSVHRLLDERIPAFVEEMLGKTHANRIGGTDVSDTDVRAACSPIDESLLLGRFPLSGSTEVDHACAAARNAYGEWSAKPWQDRVACIRKVADELERRKYDLAIACLLEVGKSRMEAMGEAEEAVDLARYYCDEMETNNGFIRPLKRAFDNEHTSDRLRPLGVFGVIAPFNFPLALSVNMISAALVAGNTVVYKPSENAGLTGALLIEAMEAAGLPAGVLNLICGDGQTGQAMIDHPGFDGFAFTGSYGVGMRILRQVAGGRYNRPVIVEMGGKNPTYVTASADLDVAAEGVMRSAFGLQGQKCSAGSNVYVHESVKQPFLDRLLALTAGIKTGDPRGMDVFMGPLINKASFERFETAVTRARADGNVIVGGSRLSGGIFDRGYYVEPTIVDGLPGDHSLNRDELFLPFLSVQSFTSLEDAIADGNSVDFGLTAGCYTRNEEELHIFLDRAEAGALYANRASGATTGAWPGIQTFCGWKGSGVSSKGGLGPYYVQQFMREQSHTIWHG